MNTQIVEYSKTAAAIAELTDIYKGAVYDVTTTKGMKDAKDGRAELRTLRVDLEAMRVSIKAPALERCRLIDAEAKDITAKIKALEDPIDAQIKFEENKEKEAAMAKAIAERQAQEAAEAKVKFERDEAERLAREAEQAKMAAERAEIAKMRAEQEARDRAARDAIEAAERASRLKIEEEQRAARFAQEAEAAKMKAERDAIEAASKKLRDEQEAKDRAEAAKIQAGKDAQAAIEREAQRKENLRLDGKEVLKVFVGQYGAIEEFSDVVKAINKFLNAQSNQVSKG